jgi:hypothetical protein
MFLLHWIKITILSYENENIIVSTVNPALTTTSE